MALRTPPSWLQNGSHPAENDRLTMQGIVSSTGIIGTSSLQVTAQASPNMTVNVATGWAGIVSSTSNAGVYLAYNDATTVLTIGTADTVNSRKDIIVATVSDSYYSGSTNTVAFQVIAGTAASVPTPPSTPTNSILLATITVVANTTTITSGNIVDGRTVASSNLINGVSLPFTGGTLTGGLVLSGGSSTVAPLKISNATVLATPTGGAVEYDGNVGYLTPNSSATGGRGLVATEFIYVNNGNRALTTGAGALSYQAIYGSTSGTGVGLSLAANTTYEFELQGHVAYAATVSNSLSLQLTYSGTPTQINGWFESALDGSSFVIQQASSSSTNISNILYSNVGSTSGTIVVDFRVKGILRTNTAGTFTPQIKLSAQPTISVFTISNNAFVKVKAIGSNTVTNIGAWA